tara:strand:+ start:3123 stop:4028 length:906 start_codon:yes stop_codon:yes gene_type:complete
MPAWLAPALIGAAVGFGSSAIQRGEAKSAKRDEDRYLDELLASNQAGWNMNKSLTIAKRDESIRAIKLRESNEKKFAAFKDANNQQAYKQSVAIYEYQNRQAARQYEKSEDLYRDSLSLNARAAENAKEQEINQLMEERQKFAFENEDNILEDLMAAGTLAATGLQGRSAKKAAQAQMASLGRNTAIMTESLISADRNTRSNLKDISRKLDEANTLAEARRMLKPEKGPAPLAPLSQPINDYQLPRELQDFDFGVTPIRGMSTIQVPSWGSVFANAATSAVSMGMNHYSGTPKTTYDYGNR